jgi:hypothetical protein
MAAVVSGGIALFKVNGAQLALRGSAVITPQISKRTPIVNQDQTVVFTVTGAAPGFKMNLSDSASLSLASLSAISDATLQLQLTNGKTYSLTNASQTGDMEDNTEDGSISVEFTGDTLQELGVTTS